MDGTIKSINAYKCLLFLIIVSMGLDCWLPCLCQMSEHGRESVQAQMETKTLHYSLRKALGNMSL